MRHYFYYLLFIFISFSNLNFAQDKPNVIFILADDLGYGDLSYLNANSKIYTPHIDQLAREGKSFKDAHAPASLCTPTRYAILTGRYGWRSSLKKGVLKHNDPPLIEKGRFTIGGIALYHLFNIGNLVLRYSVGYQNSLHIFQIILGGFLYGYDHAGFCRVAERH